MNKPGIGLRQCIFLLLSLSSYVEIDAFSLLHHHLDSPRAARRRHILQAHSDVPPADSDDAVADAGIRLNKVFKATHSRRQADELISSGRVTVNGLPVSAGQRVVPFQDVICLDGKSIDGWEALNALSHPETVHTASATPQSTTSTFEYTKYWKPTGVICTTDRRIRDNIIDALMADGYSPKHRIYPVGRLDRDTSGLILLTSDGRLPNAALRGEHKQPKTYCVRVDRPIADRDLADLANGVVITTVAQRDGNRAPPLTAKTRPCLVERIDERSMYMTITEGRNRQIRKMLEAIGFTVVRLERIRFAGLELDPLQGPGDWRRLDDGEMTMIQRILTNANATASSAAAQ